MYPLWKERYGHSLESRMRPLRQIPKKACLRAWRLETNGMGPKMSIEMKQRRSCLRCEPHPALWGDATPESSDMEPESSSEPEPQSEYEIGRHYH